MDRRPAPRLPGALDCEVSIGTGWGWLLRGLVEHLITLGAVPRFWQVKEKFGGLRAYGPRDDVIDVYESLSFETCEVCGEPGDLRQGSWVRTLSDHHADGKRSLRSNLR